MASGFIELPDGNTWSCRYTGYDLLLEDIAAELSTEGEEGELKNWLNYLQPNEEAGDVESGYCFYKHNSPDTVLRILDLRRMKDNYAQLFWKAAQLAEAKYKGTDRGYDLERFASIYRASLQNPPVPVEEIDDIENDLFFLNGHTIGKWPPKPEE